MLMLKTTMVGHHCMLLPIGDKRKQPKCCSMLWPIWMHAIMPVRRVSMWPNVKWSNFWRNTEPTINALNEGHLVKSGMRSRQNYIQLWKYLKIFVISIYSRISDTIENHMDKTPPKIIRVEVRPENNKDHPNGKFH